MHIENELLEFVTAREQEYDDVIEEYEEEVLVQEEFPGPPVTDAIDSAPAQGKPRCITCILIIMIYIYVVHLCCRNFYDTHIHIFISTHESY
jgi:hypothetical protein